MGSIRRRGEYQFQASIRMKGVRPQTKTFETLQEAEDWIAVTEAQIRDGKFVDRRKAQKTSFATILRRYEEEVAPTKRGGDTEIVRLRRMRDHPIAQKSLADLGPADFSGYRDERLEQVSAGTVLRELGVLSAVLNCAIKDWGYPINNPIPKIRKPPAPEHRERRLEGDEEERLLKAARSSLCRAPQLADAIILAVETGMRASEMLRLSRSCVSVTGQHVLVEKSKNRAKRLVPLSRTAEATLRRLMDNAPGEKLFSFHDSRGLSAAFRRACERAGIQGLTFHDLRHEAASRMAKRIPAPVMLAKIMGWKTLQMAMRYYNPTIDELVEAVRAA